MNPKIIGISIAAGVASTLCVVAAAQAGIAGALLMLIAPLPIYIAALGFGKHAAIGASAAALISTAFGVSPMFAVLVGLLYTVPASFVGHQANLSQQHEDGQLEWYPLPNLLFNLSALIAIGPIIMAFYSGYDPESMAPALKELFLEIMAQNPQAPPINQTDLDALIPSLLKISPFLFGGFWLIIHALNYQLGAAITRSSGYLPRPKDDVAATLSLPKIAVIIALVSVVLAVSTSGIVQFAASAIAGVFNMALAFVGLAAAHERARTNSGQLFLLILSYLIIIIFYFPIVLFAIGGIIRIFSNDPKNSQPPLG